MVAVLVVTRVFIEAQHSSALALVAVVAEEAETRLGIPVVLVELVVARAVSQVQPRVFQVAVVLVRQALVVQPEAVVAIQGQVGLRLLVVRELMAVQRQVLMVVVQPEDLPPEVMVV